MLPESDYAKLLKTFLRVTEANKGLVAEADDRILDAEGLALKFCYHATSALQLYRGTSVPEVGAGFYDPATVNVVCRAALETFLVFHYIYVEPKTEEERDCRYIAWILGGYLERQKLPAWSDEARAIQEREAFLIGPLRCKLEANAVFKSLKVKEQEKTKQGEWRLRSWSAIGKSVGLHQIYAKAFYSFLCGYAHAGNLSVVQLRQADTADAQRTLCTGSMGILLIALANMVRAHCAVFPKSRSSLALEPEGAHLVEIWCGVGTHGPEDVLDE